MLLERDFISDFDAFEKGKWNFDHRKDRFLGHDFCKNRYDFELTMP